VSKAKHEITMVKVVDAQVCSTGTWDEALEYLQRKYPSGTLLNWQKNEKPEFAPLPCANGGGRTHYMFVC